MIESFKDLVVWQKSMLVIKDIYKIAGMISERNNYALIDQMRRAAISIPSNIAEGYERNSTKEYLRFLSIANGSKAELITQVEICKMLELLSDVDKLFADEVLEKLYEIGKMLNSIIKKLTPTP